MKHQTHHDLQIYKRSYALTLEIFKASAMFPKEHRYGLVDQMRRASSSVCANIAEGYGRQLSSDKEFKRYLVIAKGSCAEMNVWCELCRDLLIITPEIAKKWIDEYNEISKMIFSFMKKLN